MDLPRQPQPVWVTISGDNRQDIDYWYRLLSQRAEFKGDQVQQMNHFQFVIHPRAVND